MIGINRSDKTYQKYERCKRRVVEFMKVKYNRTDIPLRELKPKFLTDFAVFLASTYKCKQNTVYKFLQLFKEYPVKKTAREYGYDTSLYEPGNENLVIGDFGEKARRLFDMEKISEGHYMELLHKIGIDDNED